MQALSKDGRHRFFKPVTTPWEIALLTKGVRNNVSDCGMTRAIIFVSLL